MRNNYESKGKQTSGTPRENAAPAATPTLITIGLITLGAALVVFCSDLAQLRPVGEIIADSGGAAWRDGLSLGDPTPPRPSMYSMIFSVRPVKVYREHGTAGHSLVATKARYVFHNYPFLDGNGVGSSGESDQAANASMCANEQDKFWDMHSTLYANWNGKTRAHSAVAASRQWQRASGWIWMPSTAVSVPINTRPRSRQILTWVQMGVSGTPTVFVNGRRVGQN